MFVGKYNEAEQWLDFVPKENWALETSYMHDGKTDVHLNDGENSWIVNFRTCMQTNVATHKQRPVRRAVIVEPKGVAEK